jgi:glycosyltransferase involved in cell wall biosynthesis
VIDGFGSGGAQRVAASLVERWHTDGRPIDVITLLPPEADFFPIPAKLRRLTVGHVGHSSSVFGAINANWQRIASLRRALQSTDAGTIVGFQTSINILVILAALGLGRRVVISERTDPLRRDLPWPWRVLRRLLYRRADLVTANSAHAISVMQGYVPSRKLALIPNPVVSPQSAADPMNSETVLVVGRLTAIKNNGFVIEAFARAAAPARDWRLELVGDGPQRQELGALAEGLGVSAQVSLAGNASDCAPHYRRAAIFVIASLFEGSPNALLEAMAHGLPCIVSDALPGATEYIEDGKTGLTFRAGDVDHLAAQIARLMKDKAMRGSLGAAARARVKPLSLAFVAGLWDRAIEGEAVRA